MIAKLIFGIAFPCESLVGHQPPHPSHGRDAGGDQRKTCGGCLTSCAPEAQPRRGSRKNDSVGARSSGGAVIKEGVSPSLTGRRATPSARRADMSNENPRTSLLSVLHIKALGLCPVFALVSTIGSFGF